MQGLCPCSPGIFLFDGKKKYSIKKNHLTPTVLRIPLTYPSHHSGQLVQYPYYPLLQVWPTCHLPTTPILRSYSKETDEGSFPSLPAASARRRGDWGEVLSAR
jgi:hypothetical protein